MRGRLVGYTLAEGATWLGSKVLIDRHLQCFSVVQQIAQVLLVRHDSSLALDEGYLRRKGNLHHLRSGTPVQVLGRSRVRGLQLLMNRFSRDRHGAVEWHVDRDAVHVPFRVRPVGLPVK